MLKTCLAGLLLAGMTFTAQAQDPVWSGTCAQVYFMTGQRKLSSLVTQYNWISMAWSEREPGLALLAGKAKVKVSPEYTVLHDGKLVVSEAVYRSDCNFPAPDPEIVALSAKSDAGTLTTADFRGSRWIHLVKPIDLTEERCVDVFLDHGRWSGCGDPWQDGLSDNEVVCFQGKNYLRCQVECIKDIYQRPLTLAPGRCQ